MSCSLRSWRSLVNHNYLHACFSQNINPLSLSGERIHRERGFQVRRLGYHINTSEEINTVFKGVTKIMFTRDPYQKIFSAYTDKIYTTAFLPMCRDIVQRMQPWYERKYISSKAALNISFSSFLEYTLLRFGPGDGDFMMGASDHVQPPARHCDVCHVDYDVIGKMETFNDDFRYFMTIINQTKLLRSMGDMEGSNAKKALSDIVKRTLTDILDCDYKNALLRRLWSLFQIRGFIDDDFKFPLHGDEESICSIEIERFENLALDALSTSGPRAKLKSQRKEYYLKAFRSAPLDVLNRYSRFVQRDCDLFGYDCSPKEIFQGRKDGDEQRNIFSDIKYMYNL